MCINRFLQKLKFTFVGLSANAIRVYIVMYVVVTIKKLGRSTLAEIYIIFAAYMRLKMGYIG